MSLAARLARGRLHYAWIVAAVTFVVMLSSAGVRAGDRCRGYRRPSP